MWITCACTHQFGKTVFNSLPANTGRTLWCLLWASGVVSIGTKCSTKWLWGCNLGFSDSTWKQHQPFVSAYLLRLQCQSAGSLKTQECIISPGYSCGPCEFYSVVILSSHLFFAFPVNNTSLPTTTHVEIVALNWTYFLMFSLSDVKPCQSTTGLDRLSTQQASSSIDIKHIQISDLSSAKHLYCVSHCIWIYNLFYLSANY